MNLEKCAASRTNPALPEHLEQQNSTLMPCSRCAMRSTAEVREEASARLRADHRGGHRARMGGRSLRRERTRCRSRCHRSERSQKRSPPHRQRQMDQARDVLSPRRAQPSHMDRRRAVLAPKVTAQTWSFSILASSSNSKSRRRGNPDTGKNAGDSRPTSLPVGANLPEPVPSRSRRKRARASP